MKWGFSPSQALNSDWSLELGRSVFVATRPPMGAAVAVTPESTQPSGMDGGQDLRGLSPTPHLQDAHWKRSQVKGARLKW